MTRQVFASQLCDGALTGEGGDIVIDDPHNVREADPIQLDKVFLKMVGSIYADKT